jgi:hypothetical protein
VESNLRNPLFIDQAIHSELVNATRFYATTIGRLAALVAGMAVDLDVAIQTEGTLLATRVTVSTRTQLM